MLAITHFLVRNASPRGPMCFRWLIFSLSGPCELLFLFYCLLDLRSGECNVVSLYVLCCPVNGSVCFVCCVFDGVFVILLLNVMELLYVVRMPGLPKNGKRAHIAGGGRGRHNLHRVCQTAVTAPLRVCCIVWSLDFLFITFLLHFFLLSVMDIFFVDLKFCHIQFYTL